MISREQQLTIITGVGVIMESIFVYFGLETTFPQLKQIGSLEALFVEIGLAVFITVVVYVYSTRSERERKFRLRRQIIASFEMLSADFALLLTQRSSDVLNDGTIMKKNLRIFHIQNLIGVLPEKLGTISAIIPDLCEEALLIPMVKKPLDPSKFTSVDFTGCENMILKTNNVLDELRNKWKVKINPHLQERSKSMLGKQRIKIVLYIILAALFVELILIGVMSFNKDSELTYFVLGNLVTLLILMVTLRVDKKSSDSTTEKLDNITQRLTNIETKIDGLQDDGV